MNKKNLYQIFLFLCIFALIFSNAFALNGHFYFVLISSLSGIGIGYLISKLRPEGV